ncbi:MAG: FAD-dependent oxidoreductase [Planctomycetaceae bacterium]
MMYLHSGHWHSTVLCLIAMLSIAGQPSDAAEPTAIRADIVVYGGTSAAITAAVEAKRQGKTVVVVSPDKHLGGLSSGGLGWTDTGNKQVIGGLAREFYHRVWKHYDQAPAWIWQTRESYGNKGQGNAAIDGAQRTMWIFEPHVAETVFDDWVKEFGIDVYREHLLDRESGVELADGKIKSIRTLDGKTFQASMFIDATYEGDLMAAAGVSYHVGRESTDQYGEKWNGVQTGVLHHGHHFGVLPHGISPYVVPGDASSGVLPRISTQPPGQYGAADHRVQAYCFRMCLTDHPENRVPFPKPDGYDPAQYELLRRVLDAGWREAFRKFDPIPNRKTDTNNHGPFSTDNIGFNYDYPDASYERRREIIQEHRQYQQGLMYYLCNDPKVPQDVRDVMNQWGLSKDEFVDNQNWPHQIYVREARRMIGQYVMTENELLKRRPTPDSIGMGSYTIDSHNVQRYIQPDGFVQNEGDIGVPTAGPYQIAMGSILPKRDQVQNLVVPVCVSSSHIAFGSIRMEPVFMILGESAAAVTVLAIDRQSAVQDVPYAAVRERLLESGQVLEYDQPHDGRIAVDTIAGIVVDETRAKQTGNWVGSHGAPKWIGDQYVHDNNDKTRVSQIRFEAALPESGRYQVAFSFPPNSNRATAVPVTVIHAQGSTTVLIDQRKATDPQQWVALGTFSFEQDKPATVIVSNENTQGYVVADAVQWLKARE